jgi:antitoxin (DNA-binding transcriptional repressor) of toxin-antitoxin stability system
MEKTSPLQNRVGLKELRENMEKYITAVSGGATLTVFRRSTPLFTISPLRPDSVEPGWETIADFKREFGEGVPLDELLTSLETYGSQSKISQ